MTPNTLLSIMSALTVAFAVGTAEGNPAARSAEDPCAVLTAGELAPLLGEKLATSPSNSPGCTWFGSDTNRMFSYDTAWNDYHVNVLGGLPLPEHYALLQGDEITDLQGVADKAKVYVFERKEIGGEGFVVTVLALKGERLLSFNLSEPTAPPREETGKAIGLARVIASRL